jgi:hypothetical protein
LQRFGNGVRDLKRLPCFEAEISNGARVFDVSIAMTCEVEFMSGQAQLKLIGAKELSGEHFGESSGSDGWEGVRNVLVQSGGREKVLKLGTSWA